MITEFSMFAGYGGSLFALKKAEIEHQCIGFSEIDKYAIQCFEQNFPGVKNYGDCRGINTNVLPDFDLLTAGFPCQSFSSAGKMQGEADPRGTLFYEIIRIAEIKQPKYMLLENVRELASKKFKDTFDKIISELRRIGYYVHWKVLNSKDFGIPQSRARIWFVCFRDYPDFEEFKFPEPVELKIFIKDIIEENIDRKYYLSERLQLKFSKYLEEKQIVAMRKAERNTPKELREYDGQQLKPREDGCSNTISTIQKDNLFIVGHSRDKEGNTIGYPLKDIAGTLKGPSGNQADYVYEPFSVQLANKNRGKIPYDSENREMTFDINKEPVSYTIKQAQHEFLVANLDAERQDFNLVGKVGQLRRLTPKECFRLMGFLNDEIKLEGLSDAQRYKLAGNGWEINLASKILREMFI